MKFGILLRSQFLPHEDAAQCFADVCAMARHADALGFDNLVKGSHYGGADLLDFQQMPLLARLAVEAPNCRLTTGIVLLSLHKPLDIAEQIATLDVISSGRVNFGCGLGYRDVEFEAFGTNQAERVARLEENLDVIKRLWTQASVTHTGSHFTLRDVSPSIRPVQRPRPPIWMGANADGAIRRAARLADCWYLPPHNRGDTLTRQMDVYKAELEKLDKPLPSELPIRREVFVAPTRAEAMRHWSGAIERKYQSYNQWGQGKPMPEGDNDLGQALDELMQDRFLVGEPDAVTESIVNLCAPLGITQLVISVHNPGMDVQAALDSMQLFAEQVMPAVNQAML
jgi:alkanesulfonate monooxygenase SsuD/methylene tetrahydromethanopterin reductase-like flavin-dependent oxidoreductase (luciferase family)